MNSSPALRDNQTTSSQVWLRPALILLLLAAFALRLANLDLQDIWWDEARNLDVALRPFVQIATAPELDIQPPFYYYILHGWLRIMGVGIGDPPAVLAWSARFVSVFFGVVLVTMTGNLARRLGGVFALFAAVAFGAFSPFWLAESQETRMYTLVLSLLAVAAIALLKALTVLSIRGDEAEAQSETPVARRPNLRFYAAFVIASACAFLVHYNAVFVLVAWYAWWLLFALARGGGWQARWRALKPLLLCGGATTLLVLPIAPVALRQIPDYGNANLVVPTAADYLLQNLRGHLAGYTWEPAALFGYADWWVWAVLALGTGGLLLLTFRARHDGYLRDLSFLLTWFAGGLLLYYIAVLDRGAFNIRYSAMVTPALVALLGAGAAGWNFVRRIPLGMLFVALVVVGMLPFVRTDLTEARFFREDMQGVTDWLRENTRPGDVIFVDQKYPFGFYYDRYVIEERAQPEGDEAAPSRYLFVDINTLADRLNKWAGNAERVFWVQWFESDTDPRHAVPFLLDQNGKHAGEEWFQGWSIDWWNLDPPNQFVLGEGLSPSTLHFTLPDGTPAVETVEASLPATIDAASGAPVVLRWQRSAGHGGLRPLKARVALYDDAENRIAQADERILNDRHLAPSEWANGDAPLNVYLPVPDTLLSPGVYALRLLVYDAETLEPLTLLDAAGNPAGIEATLGEVTVE